MSSCNVSKRLKGYLSIVLDRDSVECDTLSIFLSKLKKYRDNFSVKFDESIDLCFKMGVDAKKSDQIIRGSCVLPHSIGNEVKALVFVGDAMLPEVLKAGASIAGGDDLIDDVASGKYVYGRDFTTCLATQDMMLKLAKVARILGPKGVMPSVKSGTVSSNIMASLGEVMRGRVNFRSDKFGFIRMSFAKLSFSDQQVCDNLAFVYNAIKNVKPASIKANYFVSLRLTTTMMGVSFLIKMSELYKLKGCK